jgi:hypothetical protein
MLWFKSLWRKLFKVRTGVYESAPMIAQDATMYDPSEDPEKIMTGEIESYFE